MHVLAREPEIIIAEFAGHDDIVIDRHMIQVFGRKTLQDAGEARAGAAAAERQRPGAVGGDAFGMEQPVQQPVGRQVVVQQFRSVRVPPASSRCASFPPEPRRSGPGRCRRRRQPFPGSARRPASRRGLLAGQVHLAAQLLAGVEVVQCHFGQRTALDRDNALVAVLLAALTTVNAR